MIYVHARDFGWLWASTQQAAGGKWAFDLASFGLGLAVAFLLIGIAYRGRHQIAQRRNQVRETANQLRRRLSANAVTRYSADIIETGQTMHLLGALAPLEQIYVERRLYAPFAAAEDADDRVSLSPLQSIQASDRLCIFGRPGSGRTTMLSHLLLLQANLIRTTGDSERVPVYVFLPVLADELAETAESDASRNERDLAQRLAQTALSCMSRQTATSGVRWLRQQIENGNGLILLDGWDEVPVKARLALTRWVEDLVTAHPGNRLVISAGERGYGPLLEVGFVPLRLAPWTQKQLADLSKKWSAAWPLRKGDQDSPLPYVSYSLTPPTPFEATIEMAIQLGGQTPASTPAGKMTQVMDLLLPQAEADDKGHEAWPLVTGHQALGRLGLAVLEQDRPILEREEIQAAVNAAMPPPQQAVDQDPEEHNTKLKMGREEQERRTLRAVDCCRALTAAGAPLRAWDSQRYYFSHPLVAAYLTARYLMSEGSAAIARPDDPAWFDVLRFYVGLAPAERLIERLLRIPDDLFLNNFWTAATLLTSAYSDRSPWGEGLTKRLARFFLNPRLPGLFRDRCLDALVHSGESGVRQLFTQAIKSSDPNLRAESVLGLGALGQEQDLSLIEAALDDSDAQVRSAAINAVRILSRKGVEQTLDLLIAAMIEAGDEIQRIAVEALADLGPAGQAVLRDGAQDHDVVVRRGAVYGLAFTGELWARKTLEKLQKEDDEWLVRNAAAEALAGLDAADQADAPLDVTLPLAETESWLIAWAAEQGEGIGVGKAALDTLLHALQAEDLSIREMAIETLKRLADPRSIEALRQQLRDPEPSVRDAALLALDEISRRHDLSLRRS